MCARPLAPPEGELSSEARLRGGSRQKAPSAPFGGTSPKGGGFGPLKTVDLCLPPTGGKVARRAG